MPNPSSIKILLLLLVLSLPRFASAEDSAVPERNDQAGHQVVTHRSVSSQSLNLSQLRAVFSMQVRQWPNGQPIEVFVLPDDDRVHHEFLKNTLKMLPHQLRRHWDRYVYSGIGQGPTIVKDQQEMLERVRSVAGAIGYVERGVPDDQVLSLDIR
jgi:ABC-type phosphate transport system substrate-binding protein